MTPLAWLVLAFLQDAQVPTFRSEVNLVRVEARVSDASGKDIPGLTARDFVVKDENEIRPLVDFSRESQPLDVLLLLDVSGSMAPFLRQLTTTAGSALSQLRDGDRVGVMVFASRALEVQPFTPDFRLVERQIAASIFKQQAGRGTLVNEALLAAANTIQHTAKEGASRAIVIVTDNLGARGAAQDADVLRALQSGNVVLDAILTATQEAIVPARYGAPHGGPPDVSQYVHATGGSVTTVSDVAEALRHTVERLRTRYTLQYAAPAGAEPGKYRHIKVELGREAAKRYPGMSVSAREGYYAAQ